jgi:signal transduction histidine kinase
VSQRMALLLIELEQLAQRIPKEQNDIRTSVLGVRARADEISSEIHRVSHQLHSSKLEHMGLSAAAKSYCEELGAHHEIKIGFHDSGCPVELPSELTLCLFRIIQESLRNVVKHSGAREARVVLSGTEHQVHLSVSDCGKGFDPRSAEAQKGLGLISMRERLRSVDGEMSIYSDTQGTKIGVWVNRITEPQSV